MLPEAESGVDGPVVDGGSLPGKVVEGPGIQSLDAVPKIPLMDALQEAMQEISISSILPPSASTNALSSMIEPNGKNHTGVSQRSAVEVRFLLTQLIFIVYHTSFFCKLTDQDRPSYGRITTG